MRDNDVEKRVNACDRELQRHPWSLVRIFNREYRNCVHTLTRGAGAPVLVRWGYRASLMAWRKIQCKSFESFDASLASWQTTKMNLLHMCNNMTPRANQISTIIRQHTRIACDSSLTKIALTTVDAARAPDCTAWYDTSNTNIMTGTLGGREQYSYKNEIVFRMDTAWHTKIVGDHVGMSIHNGGRKKKSQRTRSIPLEQRSQPCRASAQGAVQYRADGQCGPDGRSSAQALRMYSNTTWVMCSIDGEW
jgi:hypothetical protein